MWTVLGKSICPAGRGFRRSWVKIACARSSLSRSSVPSLEFCRPQNPSWKASIELLADRLREVFQATQFGGTASLTSALAAALVFVASDPQVKLSSDVANLTSMLAYQPPVYTAINGARGEEIKKLLEAWVMRDTDDASLLAQNISLALNHNLSVGRELAEAMLKKDDLAPQVAQQAMSLLARSGKKEDATLLARFLKDEAALANFNTNEANRDVPKVCDYAMAMMIALTGNKPQEYYEGPLRWGQGWNADLQSLAFRTEDDRQAALTKWKAGWRNTRNRWVRSQPAPRDDVKGNFTGLLSRPNRSKTAQIIYCKVPTCDKSRPAPPARPVRCDICARMCDS